MRQRVKRIATVSGLIVLLGIFYVLAAAPIFDFIPSFDIQNVEVSAIVPFLTPFLAYIGIIKFVKYPIRFITSNRILGAYAIAFTAGGVFFMIQYALIISSTISNNDMGIVLEIIGFVIYLNPLKKHVVKLLMDDDEEEEEENEEEKKKKEEKKYEIYDLVTTTTAIMLVLVGLTLQLSYFNPS